VSLFPDLHLQVEQFKHLQVGARIYQDPKMRRNFFEDLAHEKNFSPESVSHWYGITLKDVVKRKGGTLVIEYHNNSQSQALQDLFPDLPWDSSRFVSQWENVMRRREFFDNIAHLAGFDPLNAEKWYRLPSLAITKRRFGRQILKYHGDSHVKAIVDLYSEVNFQLHKFTERKKQEKTVTQSSSMAINLPITTTSNEMR